MGWYSSIKGLVSDMNVNITTSTWLKNNLCNCIYSSCRTAIIYPFYKLKSARWYYTQKFKTRPCRKRHWPCPLFV